MFQRASLFEQRLCNWEVNQVKEILFMFESISCTPTDCLDCPSTVPSNNPSTFPSIQPTSRQSTLPSILPSSIPSSNPSFVPSSQPRYVPSTVPSILPSLLQVNVMCESDEEFKFEFELKRDGKDEIYTCVRLALLPKAETLNLCDTVTLITQNFLMECGVCQLTRCKDSEQPIVGFKNDLKTCEWISQQQKRRKIVKYCRETEKVVNSCPLTCDTYLSKTPTDGLYAKIALSNFRSMRRLNLPL